MSPKDERFTVELREAGGIISARTIDKNPLRELKPSFKSLCVPVQLRCGFTPHSLIWDNFA
jgi:hypothetical protein